MKRPDEAAVWAKVRKGHVLNVSELAIASGYDRGMLARMKLPLQGGKISLEDFQRIMRARQDRAERDRIKLRTVPAPASPPAVRNGDQAQQTLAERMFYNL